MYVYCTYLVPICSATVQTESFVLKMIRVQNVVKFEKPHKSSGLGTAATSMLLECTTAVAEVSMTENLLSVRNYKILDRDGSG